MKNRLYPSLVVVALLCVATWTVHAELQRGSSARQTWEYKSIYLTRSSAAWSGWYEDNRPLYSQVSMVSKSKELGDQGWELISVTPLSSYSGTSSPFTDGLLYVFKRPN